MKFVDKDDSLSKKKEKQNICIQTKQQFKNIL